MNNLGESINDRFKNKSLYGEGYSNSSLMANLWNRLVYRLGHTSWSRLWSRLRSGFRIRLDFRYWEIVRNNRLRSRFMVNLGESIKNKIYNRFWNEL